MNSIRFSKYEALGNDFILIDESQDKKRRSEPSTSLSLRRALCERKSGIGADGVITLLSSLNANAQIFMHLTNADGSIAENCGNGLRCVAQWLLENERIKIDQEFYIDTLSGLKKAKISHDQITVELGVANVNVQIDKTDILREASLFASTHHAMAPTTVAFVTIGNPHLVMEVSDVDLAQTGLGPHLEKLPLFPHGANVGFVAVRGPNEVELRVWERGAGATDACGSGAGAAVSALVVKRVLSPNTKINVHFKNGALQVVVMPKSEVEMLVEICGSAQKCFEGIWEAAESIC